MHVHGLSVMVGVHKLLAMLAAVLDVVAQAPVQVGLACHVVLVQLCGVARRPTRASAT